MREIGLRVEVGYVIEGDHTMEGGMAAAQQILAMPERPTAVICSNDMTAIGMMRERISARHPRSPRSVCNRF